MRSVFVILLLFLSNISWAQCDPYPAMTIQESRPDSASEWNNNVRNFFLYDDAWNTSRHEVNIFYSEEWRLRSITEKEFDQTGNVTYNHLLDYDYRNNYLRIDHEVFSDWDGDQEIRREEIKRDLEDGIIYHSIRTGTISSGEITTENEITYPDFTITSITIQTYNSAGYETSYYHEGYNKDGVLLKEKIEFFFDENNCETGFVESNGENGFLVPRDSIHSVMNEYCEAIEKYYFEYQNGQWVLYESEAFRYTREFNDQELLTYYLKEKQRRDEWLIEDEEKYEYDENGYLTYVFENHSPIEDEQQLISYSDDYRTTEVLLQRRRPSEGNIWVDVKKTRVTQDESGNSIYSGVWRYFEEFAKLELTTEEIREFNSAGNLEIYSYYSAYPPAQDFTKSLRHYSYGCNDRYEGYISTTIDNSDPSLIGHQTRIVFEFSDLVTGMENPGPQIALYPNPAKNEIFLNIASGEPLNMTLTDLQGKVIRQYDRIIVDDPLKIDVSGLMNGIYLLGISSRNFRYSYKIIVSH